MMYTGVARMVSLLMAATLAVLITLYPLPLAHMSHGMLSLLVWGVCAGFVHGMGFDPQSRVWRWLLSPLLAWSLMAWGVVAVILGK